MTDPDVVAELDAWIVAFKDGQPTLPPTLNSGAWAGISYEAVQRARDEIVQLRKALHAEMMGRPDKWHAFIAEARDEALEEAAHECDEEAKGSGGEVAFRDGCETCAAAIRLLKGGPKCL